jgi:hypothetical protein
MKTKTFLSVLAVALITVMFSSCEKINGKGDVITEARYVSGYSEISLSMSGTVYFNPGPEYTLEIEGQENIINQVVTRVEGNTLVLRLKNNVILGSHDPIRFRITAPDVSRFDISGSGDIYVDTLVSCTELSANISGSGSIRFSEIDVERFHAKISGSGDIRALAGTAGRSDIRISGSGNVESQYVQANDVYTETSGSGEIYVHAVSLLDVSISGSGNVYYYGTPVINTHISGSGNIHHL